MQKWTTHPFVRLGDSDGSVTGRGFPVTANHLRL